MAVIPVAPVVDVPDAPDAAQAERHGVGQAPPAVPAGGVGPAAEHRSARGLGQRRVDQVLRPVGHDGQTEQAQPTTPRTRRGRPSPTPWRAPAHTKSAVSDHRHQGHLDREFAGDPPQCETDDGQRFPPHREVGVDHERRTDHADCEEEPRHAAMKHRRTSRGKARPARRPGGGGGTGHGAHCRLDIRGHTWNDSAVWTQAFSTWRLRRSTCTWRWPRCSTRRPSPAGTRSPA